MPEDLPKVEHVKEAEKRIEQVANSEELVTNSNHKEMNVLNNGENTENN
jgi:hypothetical protein